jgi:tetratricopeptide (TPR) repeat protein
MDLASVRGPSFTGAFLAVLALGLAVAYGNGFGAGFYFDDVAGIVENPAIRSPANLPSFFTDPRTLTTAREGLDLRPVVAASFALNYAVSGLEPWSYHALQLLLHFATAWMVFVLVRDHLWWPLSERGPDGLARFPAAAAALLFAMAPGNNQAVNYAWARPEVLGSALFLGAFLAMMRSRVFAAVLLYALALWTNVAALMLPAAFVAYDVLYRDRERLPDLRSWLREWKDLIPPLLPLLLVGGAFLLQRHLLLPEGAGDAMPPKWLTPWVASMTQWAALLHDARQFVWPTGLSVDHAFPFTMSFAEPRAWGSLVLLLAWIAAAALGARRFPQIAFATAWVFLVLAPEAVSAPVSAVVRDHRPYLASTLGLSLLLAVGLAEASRRARRHRFEVLAAALLGLVLVSATLGRLRTAEWADPGALWESALRVDPENGRAWMQSGLERFRRGDLREARRRYERSRSLLPTSPHLFAYFAMLEAAEGRSEEALAKAKQAVRFGPNLALAHRVLGEVQEEAGYRREAAASFRRAVALAPGDSRSGVALERLEKEGAPLAEPGQSLPQPEGAEGESPGSSELGVLPSPGN